MEENLALWVQSHVKSGKVTRFQDYENRQPAPHIKCNDAFTMSVQASEVHYCTPRDNKGPYSAFEVFCESEHEPLLDEYRYSEDEPCSNVPLSVICKIIIKHGGVKV